MSHACTHKENISYDSCKFSGGRGLPGPPPPPVLIPAHSHTSTLYNLPKLMSKVYSHYPSMVVQCRSVSGRFYTRNTSGSCC